MFNTFHKIGIPPLILLAFTKSNSKTTAHIMYAASIAPTSLRIK
jgi:hypothetical protein